MPSLLGLNKALFSQIDHRRADVVLYELHEKDDSLVGNPLAFQYFPETLSDSKAVNYQQKEIPGGSLPLYQWVSSGERLITFTAIFTSDMDVIDVPQSRQGATSRDNIDIRAALLWLRRHMLPRYSSESSNTTNPVAHRQTAATRSRTFAPRKLRLYIPNSGLGLAGGGRSAADISDDAVTVLLTQCEINYQGWFPSGLPQSVEVQLSFAETPQIGGRVFFPSVTNEIDRLVHTGGDAEHGEEGEVASSIFSYQIQPRFKRGKKG